MNNKVYSKSRLVRSLTALLMAIVCIITVLPQGSMVAQAAPLVQAPAIVSKSSNALWANGSSYADDNGLDAIKWHYNSTEGKYYLYLPSSVDLNNLTVWHTFSNDMYVNGTKIVSGETTNIFAGGGNYTIKAGSNTYKLVVMQSTNINTMFITTKSGSLDAVNNSTNHTVVDSGQIVYVDTKGKAQNVELTQIKGRGNSSWEAAQKLFYKYPYNIKLESKVALYGMKKSKKWCLLANDFDQSLLRNKFIFDIAQDAGMAYTPEHEYADVYQNGRYIGNYLVTSKVEVDKNRVNITDLEGATEEVNKEQALEKYSRGGNTTSTAANTNKYYNIPNNPADITGGYLLEFELDERYPNELSGFVSEKSQPVVVKSPEFASKAQVEYIQNYFKQMESAVYNTNTGKSYEGKYYTEYLDLESAAEMYIIEELSMDPDAVSTSFYMYKDVDGKIYFGPSWDFDWALGGYNRSELLNTSKLLLTDKKVYHNSALNFMGALAKHKDFQDMVKKVWKEKFSPLLSVSTGNTEPYTDSVRSIREYGNMLENSAAMNFSRYGHILGSALWGSTYTGSTYRDNVNYVKNFVTKRVDYLNSIWNKGSDDPDPSKKTTLYFDNSNANWSEVHAYVWNNTTDFNCFAGTKISGTNIYKFEIEGSYANVLFKNTAGTTNWNLKTQDQVIPTNGNNCFKAYSGANNGTGVWSTYYGEPIVTPVPGSNTIYFDNSNANWSEVHAYVWNNTTDFNCFAGTKVSGTNIYKFKIEGSYANVLFKNTAGTDTWNLQTADQVIPTNGNNCFKAYSGSNKTAGQWTTYQDTIITPVPATTAPVPATTAPVPQTPGPVDGDTVLYFDNSNANWSEVYAYVWNNTTDFDWFAGVKVEGTNLYKVTIDGKFANVLFKNTEGTTVWNLQTADQVIPTNGNNCFKPYSGSNKTAGEWYKYTDTTVTATPKVTPEITPKVTPKVTPEITPEVTPVVTGNKLTLYYKKTSWSQVYCHYKTENGAWTTVPGVKMEASSEQTGYQWKIVLDLGSDKAAVVCFNNGTGVWDSNGGKNYTIPMGTYGVMNTNISELKPVSTPKVTPTVSPKVTPTVSPKITPEVTPEVTPKVTVTPVPVENTVTLYYKKTSWSDVYCHYKPENGTWSTVPGTKMVATNEQSGYQWKIVLDLGSSNSATVCFNNGSGSWDSNNGSNYIVYKGTYGVSNQVVSQLQSVAPTTTPKVTPEVTVSPTKHQVTLYYKKTSWSNVYCHYKKADGTWTSVPGTKMQATTEKSGYQWKIVIDLGDATSTTVCFNNGGGSWDNNNRQNYTISEGTQGVSDGTVKKLS